MCFDVSSINTNTLQIVLLELCDQMLLINLLIYVNHSSPTPTTNNPPTLSPPTPKIYGLHSLSMCNIDHNYKITKAYSSWTFTQQITVFHLQLEICPEMQSEACQI